MAIHNRKEVFLFLEQVYQKDSNPSLMQRKSLAAVLGISLIQVSAWFVRRNNRGSNQRSSKIAFNAEKRAKLVKHFEMEQKPSLSTIQVLAKSLHLTENQVRQWFYRQRSKVLTSSSNSNIKEVEGNQPSSKNQAQNLLETIESHVSNEGESGQVSNDAKLTQGEVKKTQLNSNGCDVGIKAGPSGLNSKQTQPKVTVWRHVTLPPNHLLVTKRMNSSDISELNDIRALQGQVSRLSMQNCILKAVNEELQRQIVEMQRQETLSVISWPEQQQILLNFVDSLTNTIPMMFGIVPPPPSSLAPFGVEHKKE